MGDDCWQALLNRCDAFRKSKQELGKSEAGSFGYNERIGLDAS